METLTTEEAAKYLSTTKQQIRHLIKRGQLKAYNIGTDKRALWRIPIANIKALIENNKGE